MARKKGLWFAKLSGGSYDGEVLALPHLFLEMLRPREAQYSDSTYDCHTNMDLYGKPYNPSVTYDRYTLTDSVIVGDVLAIGFGDVETIEATNVEQHIFTYAGIVGGEYEPCPN